MTKRMDAGATLSRRQAKILSLAKRETSREHAAEFDPIVRGPIFAVVALSGVVAAGAICMVWTTAIRFLSKIGGKKAVA